MTGLELLLGYVIGIGTEASWDRLKHLYESARRAGLDVRALWVKAFREALEIHAKTYDRAARDVIAPFAAAFEREPQIVVDALVDQHASSYEEFFRSIEDRNFQLDLSTALIRRYRIQPATDADLLSRVVSDVVRFFSLGVLRTISRDDQLRIVFLQVIKLDGIASALEGLRQSVATRDDLSAAAAEIRAQIGEEVSQLGATLTTLIASVPAVDAPPLDFVQRIQVLVAELEQLLRTRGYRRSSELVSGLDLVVQAAGSLDARIGFVVYAAPRLLSPNDVLIARENARKSGCDFVCLLSESFPTNEVVREAQSDRLVRVHRIDEFLNGLIDLTPYQERLRTSFTKSWLHQENLYVPLQCTRHTDTQATDLFDAVASLLSESSARPIAILGDFGSGKSTFCSLLAGRLVEEAARVGTSGRVPVLVRLQVCEQVGGLRAAIVHTLLQGGVDITGSALGELLRTGRLTLILDGLDEMTTSTDRRAIQRGLDAVAQLTTDSDSRIVVTCRTHFFRDEKDESRLGACEILYVAPWKPDALQSYLRARVGPESSDALARLMQIPALGELCRTPLFAEMVISSLDEITPGELTPRLLFATFTDRWLREQDKRSAIELGEKRDLLIALAMEMFQEGSAAIHHDELRRRIKRTFNLQTVDDVSGFDIDIRTCSFLTRDIDGNYRFVSRAFMEYFVSQALAAEFSSLVETVRVGGDLERFSFHRKKLTHLIYRFLAESGVSEESLQFLVEATRGKTFAAVSYLGANAITLLNHLEADLTKGAFGDTVLRDASLSRADLRGARFSRADLYTCNFNDAVLDEVDMRGARLECASIKATAGILDFLPPTAGSPLIVAGMRPEIVEVGWPDGRNLRNWPAHSEAVWCLAEVGPQEVLSGGKDMTLRLWRRDTAENVGTYDGHADNIWSVAVADLKGMFVSGGSY